MKMEPHATLHVPRIVPPAAPFSAFNPGEVETLFAHAPELVLGQGWSATPSPDLAPGRARVAWSESQTGEKALWIWADLTDESPHNSASAPNQRTWELGDSFEIFLSGTREGKYFEMHVTPENQTLQLQMTSRDDAFDDCKIANGPLRSATWVTPDRWQLLAMIPLESVGISTGGWLSLSRYDYQPGKAEPVLSSSSPHREINFHRRGEWTPFTLQ